MSFANSSISDIIATTIQSRSGTIADNVSDNNAILARLNSKGNRKPFGGGNVIMQELAFAENANAQWYSGYEALAIAEQDVISAAQFDIKQAAVGVTMSGLEMLQNAGKEQVIDLLEGRVRVAEDTMKNLVSAGIYSAGTGSGGKEITGLQAAVADDPTTGTYGGINRATWSFWRNQVFDISVSGSGAMSASNIQTYFNALWVLCVRGTDRPDLIMVDNAYWKFYMASLQPLQRFTDPKMASLGFPSVKFMDADVVLDGGIGGNVPSEHGYFLNTKYIFFRPHRERNFVALDPSRRWSVNQDAIVQLLAWAGNLTCNGAQYQGVIHA
jgi:hypothetical protein